MLFKPMSKTQAKELYLKTMREKNFSEIIDDETAVKLNKIYTDIMKDLVFYTKNFTIDYGRGRTDDTERIG